MQSKYLLFIWKKLAMCLLLFSCSIAFSKVKITTFVTPPYTRAITDYANISKVNVQLIADTTLTVYPQVVITGNNGVKLQSINNLMTYSSSFLMPNVPVTLTTTQLSELFTLSNLVATGMNTEQLNQFTTFGTIPNGTYSVCIEAWAYLFSAAPVKVSDGYPNGCATILIGNPSFANSLLEAPKTILPMCNQEVTLTVPQNVVFTWMHPSASMEMGNNDLPNGLQEYIIRMVEVVGNKSANEAMKTATTPIFFEKTVLGNSYVYGPSDPPLKTGSKYAYTISVRDNAKKYQNKGTSDACMFTCKQTTIYPPKSIVAPKYNIQLNTPINGKQIVSGNPIDFSWTVPTSQPNYYVLEFTNQINQNEKIKDWNNLTESLFNGKDAFFARSPQPKDNSKIPVIQQPNFQLSKSWSKSAGKIAWRILAYDKNDNRIDSSKIDKYEIIEDTAQHIEISSFMMSGFDVKVLSVLNKDSSDFSCTGEFSLWENGPKITTQFNHLKLVPFAYFPKIKKYAWVVTDGQLIVKNLKAEIYSKSNIELETTGDADGIYNLKLNSLKLQAAVTTKLNANTKVYDIVKDNSTSKINALVNWQTNWFEFKEGESVSNKNYEINSDSTDVDYSFSEKFKNAKFYFSKDEKIATATSKGISILFHGKDKSSYFAVSNFKVTPNLSGIVSIPNAVPKVDNISSGKKSGKSPFDIGNVAIEYAADLEVPFSNQQNMNFSAKVNPISWSLNKEASLSAYYEEVRIHLSENEIPEYANYPYGMIIPQLKLMLDFKAYTTKSSDKPLVLIYSKAYNIGEGISTKSTKVSNVNTAFPLGDFYAGVSDYNFLMWKNKLNALLINGNIYVPFFNKMANLQINVDNNKINPLEISFDEANQYLIGQPGSNQSFYLTFEDGSFSDNKISFTPYFSVFNKNDKGLNINNYLINSNKLFLSANGAISFSSNNENDNFKKIMKLDNYYRFGYLISKLGIQKLTNSYDYRFTFEGKIILGEKITSGNKNTIYFDFHGKAPEKSASSVTAISTKTSPFIPPTPQDLNNKKFDPNLKFLVSPLSTLEMYESATESSTSEISNNAIEFQDDGMDVNGNYEDGAQSYGGKFSFKLNDPDWGDCFIMEGKYVTKQPTSTELSSKVIIGKYKSNFNNYGYWYVDFFQKGYVVIPVIPGIAEINGFGGKAYYHMQINRDNNGKVTSLKPNKNFGLGIEAEALFRTTFDQGKTFHGQSRIVTSFDGWSLDKIEYYMQGECLAENDNSAGLIHGNIRATFDWDEKSLHAIAAAWGNVYGLFCINENKENYNMEFLINNNGVDIHLGKKDNMITASVLCLADFGAWAHINNNHLEAGVGYHFDSGWKGVIVGWKGVDVGVKGKVAADLSANIGITYYPFNASGSAHVIGTAYGSGCLSYYFGKVCYNKKASAAADLSISLPNPLLIKGNVTIDVPVIPTFSVCIQWSDGSFSFC